MALVGWAALLLLAVAPAAAKGPAAVERKLPSGATLLVSEQPALPIVTVMAVLDAGSRRDPVDAFGVANMTAETLTEGAAGRSANEIAEAIEFIGGSLNANAGVDYTTVTLKVLSRDIDQGLRLFADVLLAPTFPDEEIARAAESVLAGLRSAEDDPTEVAGRAFGRELYGDHPYAHPSEGTPESIVRIDRAAIVEFYRRHYGPARAAIVVVGEVQTDDVARRIGKALRDWQPRDAGPLRPAVLAPAGERSVQLDRPVTQAAIVMGHSGVARANPDFEALQVMNYVLGGGGFSSRLMEQIRNRAGLVYGVSSYFSGGELPGSFRIIMQTKNESVADAAAMARAELIAVRDGGITEEELQDAVRFLTGSFPLSLDSNAKIASFLAQSWFFGLGLDAAERYLRKIEAVTLQDVHRVAREYLHPDQLLTVVVADLAAAANGAGDDGAR